MKRSASQCGCRTECDCGQSEIEALNPPGLDRIHFRAGTHATFLAELLQALSSRAHPELWPLRTRERSDPTIALLDAWSSIADVLTFYQERIANEGYLRTATEQRSLEELGALVGYRARPGVAASTFVAFTLDTTLPGGVDIPAGTKIQSIPADADQIPQIFETTSTFFGKPQWNEMLPAQQEAQLLPKGTDPPLTVWVSGREASRVGDRILTGTLGAAPSDLHLEIVAAVEYRDDLDVTGLTIRERKEQVSLGKNASGPLELADVLVDFARTPVSKQRRQLALANGRAPKQVFGAAGSDTLAAAAVEIAKRESPDASRNIARVLGAPVFTSDQMLAASVMTSSAAPFGSTAGLVRELEKDGKTWNEYDAVRPTTVTLAPPPVIQVLANGGAAATNDDRRLFDNDSLNVTIDEPGKAVVKEQIDVKNGSKVLVAGDHQIEIHRDDTTRTKRLKIRIDDATATVTHSNANGTPVGDSTVLEYRDGRVSFALVPDPFSRRTLALDGQFDGIVAGQPLAVERVGATPLVLGVVKAVPAIVKLFGLTATVTVVTLDTPWLDDPKDFAGIRHVTVRALPRRLPAGGRPIERPVSGRQLLLDGLFDDLDPGRQVIIEGIRLITHAGTEIDSGLHAAERAMVRNVRTQTGPDGRTRTEVELDEDLAYSFLRSSVRVHGNVVGATHGDSRHEPLGDGNASLPFQAFALSSPPVTHLPSASGTGAASTLDVSVNGLQWQQVADLVGSGPEDRDFVTESVDGAVRINMGNGITGARPGSGQANVVARYRSGIGSGGNLEPGQLSLLADRPRGAQEVTNPLPATGGVDPDRPEWMRDRIPLTLRTLDRLVSPNDYTAFALLYSGIGKARTDEAGGRLVVTIAPAGDVEIGSDSELLRGLNRSVLDRGDPSAPVDVAVFERRLLFCSFVIEIEPNRYWEDVEPAIRAALTTSFGFEQRRLGDPLSSDEVTSVVLAVPGVEAAQIGTFGAVPTRSSLREAAKQLSEIAVAISPLNPGTILAAEVGRSDDEGVIRGAELIYVDDSFTDSILMTQAPARETC